MSSVVRSLGYAEEWRLEAFPGGFLQQLHDSRLPLSEVYHGRTAEILIGSDQSLKKIEYLCYWTSA